MEIDHKVYRIELKHTFGIYRSKNEWYDILFIYIIDGAIIGRGEVAPSARYNETIQKINPIIKNSIRLPNDLNDRKTIWEFIRPQLMGIKALEAGFSMALCDWCGQKIGRPVFELLSLNSKMLPPTSYTISIGELDEIGSKLKDAESYSILKVKLGTPKMDKEIINEIRRHTDKLIRVDANEGWAKDDALQISFWLADRNVEFIEQPFPAKDLNDSIELKKKSPLEIFADENSMDSNDIKPIRHAFHGINIKLMKCGSLEEGKKMIKIARENGLKVMLGCMVETSVGITNASHLAGEVDFVDLDGNLLIKNDPYSGVFVNDGRLVLPESSGSGVTLNSDYSDTLR